MSEVINIDRETLRKLQLKELESLVYFDNFCKEHDLTYFLLGGGVIGAVRHPNPKESSIRRMLLITSLVVIGLEVYKQIVFTFSFSKSFSSGTM